VTRLAMALTAVLAAVGACAPPDPGTPCGYPVDYVEGVWMAEDGSPVAEAITEDSRPHRYYCTPSASIVDFFEETG
jgi:hypothetical protein